MKDASREKVGVLLVHGIGEQTRFEHLESEVRNIAVALACQGDGNRSVRVDLRTTNDAAYGAEQQTWRGEGMAPVMVEVTELDAERTPTKVTEIEFHEVWWADLDEPATLRTRIRFWLWALSMWTIRPKIGSRLPGFERMRPPSSRSVTGKGVGLWGRVRLFTVAAIFLLILTTITFLNFLGRRLLKIELPGPNILIRFIGDVKLFQQKERVGKGPLVDIHLPPRVSLRRRMVRGLAHMALADYQRWYVLAHSQGTVLSLNGLMETEYALPNYLGQGLWDRCRKQGIGSKASPLSAGEAADMMPRRPAWLEDDDIIDRRKLFAKLNGYMTYGSPIEKFATLWPAIVPLNLDEGVFNESFEWINVYDPTDPVAGKIVSFDPLATGPHPQNVSYKAGGVHLLSHILYLAFRQNKDDTLVNAVAEWLRGGRVAFPSKPSWTWPDEFQSRVYELLRVVIWLVGAWILAWGLVWLSAEVLPAPEDLLKSEGILSQVAGLFLAIVNNIAASPLAFVIVAIVLVAITGVSRLILFGRQD